MYSTAGLFGCFLVVIDEGPQLQAIIGDLNREARHTKGARDDAEKFNQFLEYCNAVGCGSQDLVVLTSRKSVAEW